MNNNDLIRQWMQEARQDPSLAFDEKEMDRILSSSSSATSYLQNKTWPELQEENARIVAYYFGGELPAWIVKLREYVYMDEISQLVRGRFIRFVQINRSSSVSTLSNGGILVDVKFFDKGIHICCRLFNGRFVQYPFDDYLTFQKLTADEIFLLSSGYPLPK
jgi:hypothetical protein